MRGSILTMEKLKILIVDDEKRVRDELSEFLIASKHKASQADLPSKALALLNADEPDIVILDIKLPEMDGLEVLDRIKHSFPNVEVIMMTGHGDMNSVIQAMRLGASDYLMKPFRLAEVQAAIERTRKFIQLSKKLKTVEFNYSLLSQEFHESAGYHMITKSPAMQSVIDLMSKVAQSDDTSVLITGESGTGKELVARGIHALSSRKGEYFYSVNVSAIPGNLFESEFFGHKKGAFTGASEEKIGWFEIAQNSTLFLDEISDIDLSLQTKFLRVLEERKVIKVGSQKEISVNVRVITATNKRLDQLVSEEKFRADLYHRLNAFEIHIPPLRERTEEIPLLLESFTAFYARKMNKPVTGLDENAVRLLTRYAFPGNVRELKNIVERAVILCEGEILHAGHFQRLDSEHTNGNSFDLGVMERNLIAQALQKMNHNKSRAAKLLNISRQALDRRMKKYNL